MTFETMTDCEQLVMKTVWDADEELSLTEITQRVNGKYHKTWALQTVSTFLARLVKKGYLRSSRQGRVFFYQIQIPLEEYKARMTNEYVNFWNHGNADEFLCALVHERSLRSDEIERIKALINYKEL